MSLFKSEKLRQTVNSQYGYVLDASAVLALLNQETGSLKVEQALLLPKTVMSVVQIGRAHV